MPTAVPQREVDIFSTVRLITSRDGQVKLWVNLGEELAPRNHRGYCAAAH